MKRIGLLLIGLTAVLSIVAQGREIALEYGSDRTCYSADGTKVYSYYGEGNMMMVRRAEEQLPKDSQIVPPDWEAYPLIIEQFYQDHKDELFAKIESLQLGKYSIVLCVYISLKTGKYVMSEIMLLKQAVDQVEQLPLDFLFSLSDTFKLNSKILDPILDMDDNRYVKYTLIW